MINSKWENIKKTKSINVPKAQNNIYTFLFIFCHYVPSIVFLKS